MAKAPARPPESSAAIAPPATQRRRAQRFQLFVLAFSTVFVALAVTAKSVPYFAFDLRITRALQAYKGGAFHALMVGLSWFGFAPQDYLIGGSTVLVLWFVGLRWEAVGLVFSGIGIAIGAVVKLIVLRPRPTADLVEVSRLLTTSSFPSGHVIMATTYGGFLLFLAITLLKPSWMRTLAIVLLALAVGLMGTSRIYLGHHWFSDTVGAYVLGGLWLAVTVKFYRWGKPRFFTRQRVARA